MQDYQSQLDNFIKMALAEDVGPGDYSTLSTIDPEKKGKAVLKIKQAGILAGVAVAEKIFQYKEPEILFHKLMNDGDAMKYGEVAFEVEAKIHTILTCERLVLNAMQRMSGIATLTNTYVKKLKGYKTKLLDTRKTTPGFRLLEKEAVKIGGAVNHRMGLYDMIMLKDNHVDYCGGITKALNKAYDYVQKHGLDLKIEIETRTLNDVKEALATNKADRVMLDNFSPDLIKEALMMIDGKCETEASGGININNLEEYAATGVDYISSGAIIHQAVSLDLSLKADLLS